MKPDLENTNMLLLSTSYYPPIEYMALLVRHDKAFIELEETYKKQTYRNRCSIMTANGSLNLTIPVVKPRSSISKTKEIKILNNDNWQTIHWRAIESAYSGSPFFLYYQDDLKEFFEVGENNLVTLNTLILNKLLEILDINCDIRNTYEFIAPGTNKLDFRYSISPKVISNPDYFNNYIQVFFNKFSFVPNLSILDLIFNLGPESKEYLQSVADAMNY